MAAIELKYDNKVVNTIKPLFYVQNSLVVKMKVSLNKTAEETKTVMSLVFLLY